MAVGEATERKRTVHRKYINYVANIIYKLSHSGLAYGSQHLCFWQVPSILSEELQFNPFMLTGSSFLGDLLNPSGTLSESEILAEVRRRKNLFEHVLIL